MWTNSIVSATTQVESLRAAKEALTALVSASSAAFTTLDARLLEERRLREAAELLQVEDNRLPTEAHIRLNTAVAQHESQQAALAASLPYLESSVHTLLQAMQSVSSQMSALAGLGTLPANFPPAPMPPVTDPPANLLDTEEDEPMALDQGPDDNMGTEPDDHMASN
ncbi:hypothetical protein DYB37_009109 [Aphanomyces astaci]|uniref:Uncharacterized protein n=1 Tax=Aphanomyces astaci TaxID=112090 RepID=A0A418CTG7_APHAT|nr:hypothetical protein DYB35_001772 [Aphanomyces astaci]RHZ14796.1 hypothetical protein DYB37_009109 [Aphanomyces astaci]